MILLTEPALAAINAELALSRRVDSALSHGWVLADIAQRAYLLTRYGETDDPVAIAALYAHRIACNKPFAALNALTGLVCGQVLLLQNGMEFNPPLPALKQLLAGLDAYQVSEPECLELLRQYAGTLLKNRRAAIWKALNKS